MPRLFWTGKLTLPMAVLVNVNGLLAALTGSSRKTAEMTRRVKRGYEAEFSDHVRRYDDLGLKYQLKAAREQLDEVDIKGRTVLDVGCGTGAISFMALERGAARVTGGDISSLMLEMAESKASALGLGPDRISFQELDAQSLPLPDDSFDAVLAGQTLGLVPDQRRALAEMVRVCRPGGLVCVSTHGPEHYWEAIDASFRAVPKRHVLGYRLEFWPISEKSLKAMMASCGLENLRFKRVIWRNVFPSGGDAFDFFASISGSFWYERFPRDQVGPTVEKTRQHFVANGVTQVTDDVVICHGFKRS
jgi:ubiquinone/menaquinone biosynthesis C-methylase UbiE